MKNYSKVLILFTFILLLNINFIESKKFTVDIGEFYLEDVIEKIEKVYEISSSSLKKGYTTELNEKDAFRITIKEKPYYIIIWNIFKNKTEVIFPESRYINITLNQTIIVDMDKDGELDIKLKLNSIEKEKIKIKIEKFSKEEIIPEGDYLELFDVTITLNRHIIEDIKDLNALILFENFGEGPSEIDIIYSIDNKKGKEVYRGIDTMVVQTEDLVTKNFGFLDLPPGKYVLETDIFYGKNQTGDSEQSFEITKKSPLKIIKKILIFISIFIGIFLIITFTKKYIKEK